MSRIHLSEVIFNQARKFFVIFPATKLSGLFLSEIIGKVLTLISLDIIVSFVFFTVFGPDLDSSISSEKVGAFCPKKISCWCLSVNVLTVYMLGVGCMTIFFWV